MGKGVGEVARLCARQGVHCLMLAGTLGAKLPGHIRVQEGTSGSQGEPAIWAYGLVPGLTTFEEAMAAPDHWLRRMASLTAQDLGESLALKRHG